jgi:hypothetical protein
MPLSRKEPIVIKRLYVYTLKELARMFVDYDRISSQEWEKEHADKIVVLAEHFDLPPGSMVIDILRVAMEVVLETGKRLEIVPDETIASED